MKIYILLIITIVLLFSLAGYTLWWLNSLCEEMNGLTKSLYASLKSGDYNTGLSKARTIEERWEEAHSMAYIVIGHYAINEINMNIVRLRSCLEQAMVDEAIVETNLLLYSFDNLSTFEKLSPANIF